MKKIMFNDRYGLTAAVLQGRKTMTRRIVPTQYVPMIEDGLQGAALIEAQRHGDAYHENEIVAVAQSYNTICTDFEKLNEVRCMCGRDVTKDKSWTNKLYVQPCLMPHQIQITDIKIERLQDITNEDCLKEGIEYSKYERNWFYTNDKNTEFHAPSPRNAFATLINRPGVGRKGLWEENPFVFAYSFKLIK